MVELASEGNAEQRTANERAVTSADLQALQQLPEAMSAAVKAGMSSVTIIIGDGAVGSIGRRVGGNLARNVVNSVK